MSVGVFCRRRSPRDPVVGSTEKRALGRRERGDEREEQRRIGQASLRRGGDLDSRSCAHVVVEADVLVYLAVGTDDVCGSE
jgi:hypothetical protein